MSQGIYGLWQLEYAKHDIPTFPVKQDKTPAIKNYLKIGLAGSRRLLPRFGLCTALGFPLGSRTRITVLDIDHDDEQFLTDCLRSYGNTPIVVRTASGNFQAWFKHDGEKRLIRPYQDLPLHI